MLGGEPLLLLAPLERSRRDLPRPDHGPADRPEATGAVGRAAGAPSEHVGHRLRP